MQMDAEEWRKGWPHPLPINPSEISNVEMVIIFHHSPFTIQSPSKSSRGVLLPAFIYPDLPTVCTRFNTPSPPFSCLTHRLCTIKVDSHQCTIFPKELTLVWGLTGVRRSKNLSNDDQRGIMTAGPALAWYAPNYCN